MIFNLENYLYRIDQVLAEKEEKEIYMIFVLVAATLIFCSYYFLWDNAKNEYDLAHKQSEALQGKINIDNAYLSSHPESMILQIAKQTKVLETEFTQYQDSNAYIKYQIEQISSLYYDEQAWGEYVDSVAQNAKRYNIKLREYANYFPDSKDDFGHVLDINVKASGKYHNMLKYINSLEQGFLVVDIHHFTLDAKEQLYTDLNISVWGITY